MSAKRRELQAPRAETVVVPKKLLDRMRQKVRGKRKKYLDAAVWEGEYGYGAGRAHPCVEFATCPHCGSPPGRLCIGDRGPKFGIHYRRSHVLRAMKRAAMEKLVEDGVVK